MIGGRSVLALIPARGGSKGVPRKNVRDVGNKPLIAWTIEAALASRYIDRAILSSDDDEIMDVAGRFGCEVPFRRPSQLASDEASAMSVVLHAVAALERRYDYLVLLQPTSPLRETADIDGAILACHERDAPSCVSLSRVDKNPGWMFTIDGDTLLHPFFPAGKIPARRQDSAPVFALNGAVYVARPELLERTGDFIGPGTIGYVMPRERSLDIDDEFDLKLAVLLKSNRT
jgi:N-acylneuraminate cytidylyltransferase